MGRAFVQAAFPVAITTWTPAFFHERFTSLIPTTLTLPFMKPSPLGEWVSQVKVDAFSGATPLALAKFEQVQTSPLELMLGNVSGSTGETSAILILVCGLYLAFRRMLNWRIPVSVMAGGYSM